MEKIVKILDLNFFNQTDLEKIHSSSLKILAEIGVKIPHKKILNIFKKNGAIVDYDNDIVKIPKKLAEDLIRNILRNQDNYYNDNQSYNYDSFKVKCWMGSSKTPEIIDYCSNYCKRESTLRDVLESITIGNNLENIERISCFVKPKKYNGKYLDILNYYLLYLFSQKRYFLNSINSLNSAKCIIEMAKIVADDEELTNGKLAEASLEPTNNLSFSKEVLDIVYEFALNKMKIFIGHWCWMGKHTPMDFISTITLYNANLLAGMLIVLLLNPTYKFFNYIGDIFTVNKNNESFPLFGSPNQLVFIMAVLQLSKYYGFKHCIVNAGLSDSIENNFQSGFERGVTLIPAIIMGADLMYFAGIVGSDQGVSLQQLVVDNELLSYINFMFSRKIKNNNQNIDIKGLKKFGIGKSFYNSINKEMIDNCYWYSDIFLTERYEDWIKNKVKRNITNKINNILTEKFPPKTIISDYKINEINKLLHTFINDDGFLNSFRTELNNIINF